LTPTKDDSRHPHTLYLVEQPYGHGQYVCDGCSLPGQGRSYHCGQCQFDLHPDCDTAREAVNPWERRRRWFALHHEALALMEQRTPEALDKAKSLLEDQLRLSPHHRASPLYNLACCESLRGNLEAALKLLQDAVTAGWTDARHMEKDEDLAPLKNLDAFKALVAALQADQPQPFRFVPPTPPAAAKNEKKEDKPAVVPLVPLQPPSVAPLQPIYPTLTPIVAPVPPAVPSAPAEVAPVAPAKPVVQPLQPAQTSSSIADFDDKLKTLEAMGFVDRRKNITLLVKHKGDLVAAIQSLLDEALFANK